MRTRKRVDLRKRKKQTPLAPSISQKTLVDVSSALTAVTGTPISGSAPLVSETFNGFIGGIQAGYNQQVGVIVLGIECSTAP
jgi:hypothetical protein